MKRVQELKKIEEGLSTWTEQSKKTYKDTYKSILKRKNEITEYLSNN